MEDPPVVLLPVEVDLQTLAEVERRFTTDAAYNASLAARRGPSGFQCRQFVHHTDEWMTTWGLMLYTQCGQQASLTAETIVHRGHRPLRA